MICATCGGSVIWMGLITNLTHTECQQCGAINNQMPEHAGEDESHD